LWGEEIPENAAPAAAELSGHRGSVSNAGKIAHIIPLNHFIIDKVSLNFVAVHQGGRDADEKKEEAPRSEVSPIPAVRL
jgi:hypothetical protein